MQNLSKNPQESIEGKDSTMQAGTSPTPYRTQHRNTKDPNMLAKNAR
ncbi:MAG: hypothetical protein NWE92_09035 [Candidatus Bathyarchaeota archaeon]|nr:hypothetical protein [Candidatus Bathyarchaeota archaeon]